MTYRILVHVDVEATSQTEAEACARKLEELMRDPMLRMAILSAGIRLTDGNGRPIVYHPQKVA